jgi:hypothetical protein
MDVVGPIKDAEYWYAQRCAVEAGVKIGNWFCVQPNRVIISAETQQEVLEKAISYNKQYSLRPSKIILLRRDEIEIPCNK